MTTTSADMPFAFWVALDSKRNTLVSKIERYRDYVERDKELYAAHPDKYASRLKNHEDKLARARQQLSEIEARFRELDAPDADALPLVYRPARLVSQYRMLYPRQFNMQQAYFELTENDTTITPQYNGEIGNAIPFSVYYGRDRRYYFSPRAKLVDVNRVGRMLLPLLERVRAGMEIYWDGNNNVARLNDDARRAEDEIEQLIAENL